MTVKFVTYLLAGAVLMSAPAVMAQNKNTLDTRMDRMEREMQTLSRSIYKGDVPPPQITSEMDINQNADMETRLNQIEEQIRNLTNMVEEANYKISQMQNQNSNNAANNNSSYGTNNDMSQPQSNNGLNGGDSGTVSSPSNDTAAPYQLGTLNNNATSPAGLYDQAFSYLQRNDYASAQASLDEFLKKYPDHALAPNAKYWLGETYYSRGDYAGASRAFAISYKDDPSGQKAPDSLLKLAMSLKQQNMTEEACLTLAEIGKQFPNAPDQIKTKAAEENKIYACP